MKKIRIFINGFGRIGRCAARILLTDERFEVVGINDIYDFKQMGMLLQHDSVHRTFPHTVEINHDKMLVNHQSISLYNIANPKELHISALDVDVFLQCSGVFLDLKSNLPYLENGAKRIIISAPASHDTPTFIYGINHDTYSDEPIISNTSCSANAIVPLFDIVERNLGIQSAMMSMYHSYTAYQRLLDVKHYSKDIRRTRSATQNIIPLESSAARATSRFFPHLEGKLYAKSIRIPISATTLYDLTLHIEKETDIEALQHLMTHEIEDKFKGILDVSSDAIVSTDMVGSPYSATIDLAFCDVCEGNLIKLSAWQDNEYGYVKRLVDMAYVVGNSL